MCLSSSFTGSLRFRGLATRNQAFLTRCLGCYPSMHNPSALTRPHHVRSCKMVRAEINASTSLICQRKSLYQAMCRLQIAVRQAQAGQPLSQNSAFALCAPQTRFHGFLSCCLASPSATLMPPAYRLLPLAHRFHWRVLVSIDRVDMFT